MGPPLNVRPAGLSSDEDDFSDDGFSFPESGKNNTPKEFPEPEKIAELPPITDDEALRIAASAGIVSEMQEIFERSDLPVDVLLQEFTPLMIASSNCKYDAMEFLLMKGANANFSRRGYSVLMSACACMKISQEEQLKCVQLLIKFGSDVNARQNNGVTPLMLLCKEGRYTVAGGLISAGANLDEQDCLGWTPLMWAVNNNSSGQANTVQILLDAGADTNITCGRGQTAHAHALNLGINHIAALIPVGSTAVTHLLSDLPPKNDTWEYLRENIETSNKQWHLWQDVSRSLHSLGLLRKYGQTFRNRDIDLMKFYSLTEDELEDMSILPIHRKRLLDATRKLHLMAWNEKSLGVREVCNIKNSYNLTDDIKIISNITRQITFIHASLAYIKLHMNPNEREQLGYKSGDLKAHIQTALKNARALHSGLRYYLRYLNNELAEQKYPPDWIGPQSQKKSRKGKVFVATLVVISVAGIIVWKAH